MEAWARAGAKDVDGALTALDELSKQRGVDGLRLMHKALILDYAGRDKEADEAYKQAIAVMGTGPARNRSLWPFSAAARPGG